MKIVLMRKEYEHESQELPGSSEKCSESCMGVFHSFKAARRNVAAYLFDELSYHASVNGNHVIVNGAVTWEMQSDSDVSVCKVSIANTDYVFTSYVLDDDEEEGENDGRKEMEDAVL